MDEKQHIVEASKSKKEFRVSTKLKREKDQDTDWHVIGEFKREYEAMQFAKEMRFLGEPS